jgi:hypothetical protein
MKIHGMMIAMVLGIGALSTGCEEQGAGTSKFASALKKVSGHIATTEGTPKISAVVGSGATKQRLKAVIDKATNRFTISDLPAGAKSIIVEQGGRTRMVEFAVNKAAPDKRSAAIPETNLVREELDLGTLREEGERLVAEHNPFETVLDTDGDGVMDFQDDDIDGDGILNEQELDSLFGDVPGYEGWGWDDEWVLEEFDCDGNGIVDWEQPDFAAECWAESWSDFWGDDYWEGEDYWSDCDCDDGYDDDYGYDDEYGYDDDDGYDDDYGYDDDGSYDDDYGYDDDGSDDYGYGDSDDGYGADW